MFFWNGTCQSGQLKCPASRPTMEGAGVHLHRVFGFGDAAFDPFLMMDDFRNDNPAL